MPLLQVSDRIKELPGQALRAVFAGVGQLLLAADRVRAQLATPADEQASQDAAAPSAPAAPAAPPAAPAAPPAAAGPATAAKSGSSVTAPEAADPADARWRSLDKTGNVRVLHDGDPDLNPDAATSSATAVAAPAVAEPAVAEPAVAEPVAAGPVAAEPAVAEPAVAEPVVAESETAEPSPVEPAPAEPGATAAAELPVAGYDGLSVASLRARLRVLDVAQVRTLLDYEQTQQNRADVVTMFQRRIAKLEQGG
jgi:hypothetical protein